MSRVRLGVLWIEVSLLILLIPIRLPAAAPVLSIQPGQGSNWVRVLGTAEAGQVYTVRGSTNLSNWKEVALLLGRPGNTSNTTSFSFLDPASAELTQRFYRLNTQAVTDTNDWKNQVYSFNEPFADTNVIPGNPRSIKFAVDLQEPYRVYYQDSSKFPFHYDFVAERLGRFAGMNHSELDSISLHTNNQQLLFGAVLLPPDAPGAQQDLGIQFVGLDIYPAAKVCDWFRLVRSTIVDVAPGKQVFYIPSLEQAAAAENAREYFASNGISVGSASMWVQGEAQIYATGWALGRLKFFRALDIRTAFNEGRLLPQDILVTDGVPAEVPLVAGLITLVPTTPNSHVAILAQSYGIPFVYLAEAGERARVQSLAGHEVVMRVRPAGYPNQVKIMDVEGALDPEFRAELLALKAPPKITITPTASYKAISSSVDALTPADIRFFGGKAANFGVLRRVLAGNSPQAIAFSFDLWNAFLDQLLAGGQTLRAFIGEKLSGYTYPPDISTLRTNLALIRDVIRKTAQFTPTQRQAIVGALAGFSPNRKIRFRSSTNVEDTDTYIGAGLYDSYSGCLADDLDDDSNGPSACDPEEPDERGVFRALQRVYASFYNDDAFIERLRLKLDETKIGMAVLVHYSFPDSIEMANGVATLNVLPTGNWKAVLNTQVGAESVTNPDGTSLPEIVEIEHYSFGDYPKLVQPSTRATPTKPYVLEWETDYRQLMNMLVAVANAYAAQFTNKNVFQLDFEYKKVQPGLLEIKQVREIPPPPKTNLPAPYLINESANFIVWQGEGGSVFEKHHLKSRLRAETLNARLDGTNRTYLSNVAFEFLDGTNVISTAGAITNWPEFSHSTDRSGTVDSWSYGSGSSRRVFSLRLDGLGLGGVPSSDAIRFLSDYSATLSATLAAPIVSVGSDGVVFWNTNLSASLVLTRSTATNEIMGVSVARAGKTAGGTFRTLTPPNGGVFIWTYPALEWIDGYLSGFTSEPVPLRNYYSLTFNPAHHNWNDEFIVDPSLDPGVSAAQRAELFSANIRLIYGFANYFGPAGRLFAVGFDNSVREVK